MAWHIAGSLACLIAGVVCFALVSQGVVQGGLGLFLLVLAAINFIMSVVILVEARKSR